MKSDNMRLIKNCIYEAIISSYGKNNETNATPIGIVFKSPKIFHIQLYKGSKTLNNLIISKCGVVNITHDIELFYNTAFKDEIDNCILKKTLFKKAESVNAPLIASADLNIEFVVEGIKEDNLKTVMICRVVKIKENAKTIWPYTRCFFAALESIIHATRIKTFFKEGNRKRAEELTKFVHYYRELIERIFPGSIYLKIVEELIDKIDSWRKNCASNSKNAM